MQIVKTKGYHVVQTINTNSFILSFYHRSSNKNYIYEIYQSITYTKIVSNAFYNERDNEVSDSDSEDTILFTAETVKTLATFLQEGNKSNQIGIKMCHDLCKQIAYLERIGLAFYGFNLDDILVINDCTFIIANIKHIIKMKEDNCIYFYSPFIKPYFSSPELNQLTNLPSKIDYRSSYYSLGALILFCLTNIYIFAEGTEENLDIDKMLQPIYYTKLYWFLRRCFHKTCEQRILLFI